jgi:hypothetical protein
VNNNDAFVKRHQTRPWTGAQINGLQRKPLICKESENRVFRFPWSKKATDGLFTTSSIIIRENVGGDADREK